MSGSSISWAICKSAPRCRQITMPATHHSVFYRPDALPAAQPTASKHWSYLINVYIMLCSKLLAVVAVSCLCVQSLLRNYEGDIEELSRKQKLAVEKVELAQMTEWKAFSKKFRLEQVSFLCFLSWFSTWQCFDTVRWASGRAFCL